MVPARREPDEESAADAAADLRALVPRIRAGDRAAFEALAEQLYERLVRSAYRYVRDVAAAEDIVQDTLLRLWTGRAHLVVQHSITSYLLGAVRNRALNYTRHQQVEARWEHQITAEESVAAWPRQGVLGPREGEEAEVAFDAYMRLVRAAVEALPERQAEAFALRVEQELSFAEIAEVMGLSLRSAQTTYLRAVQFLRARLAPYFES